MARKDIQTEYGSARKTSEGVLDEIYQQPNGSSPQFQNGKDGDVYEELWKGPYEHLKDVGAGAVMGITIKIDAVRPSFGGKWVSRFDPPKLQNGYSWFVKSINVDESQPSGSHALLRITYVARKSDWGNGQFTDDKQDVWSLTWGAYNVPALAFCSNGIDDKTGKRKTGAEYDKSAFAWKVTHCASYQHEVEGDKGNSYVWYENGERLELNDKEKDVYDRYVNNIVATYHYPIITRTQTYYLKQNTTWSEVIGMDIDRQKELDDGCPFKFPSDAKWKFMLVADNVTVTQGGPEGVKTYVYVKTWHGSIKFEEKFYSDDDSKRWGLGSL